MFIRCLKLRFLDGDKTIAVIKFVFYPPVEVSDPKNIKIEIIKIYTTIEECLKD